MRSVGNIKGRYYERYQVEDVLTFFSGQLVLARSPDGDQVFLQEVGLSRMLPPGAKEMLVNLPGEYLAPILDVIEENDRIILVHPPLGGEPISLLVQPKQGMEPVLALTIYRKLLKTAIQLKKLPLPLHTTLDPRNIIMDGTRPFILFLSLGEFSGKKADEKWRYLLPFLLTGQQLDGVDNPEMNKNIQELSDGLRNLVLHSMNPTFSMEMVLKEADQLIIPRSERKKENTDYKKWILSGGIAVVVVIGVIWGSQIMDTDAATQLEQQQIEQELKKPGASVEFDTIQFDGETGKSETLPPVVKGAFRVTGELTQTNHKPFTLRVQANKQSHFGLKLNEKGELALYQSMYDEQFELEKSGDSFQIKPGGIYQVELFYIAGKPFRVSVQERGTGRKWVAAGNVPVDSEFNIRVAGQKGTSFKGPTVAKIDEESDAMTRWMSNHPWLLVKGSGLMKGNSLHVENGARISLPSGGTSFVFQRPAEYKEDPLRFELESLNGKRYLFHWDKSGRMELASIDGELKTLGVNWAWKGWKPEEDTHISVVTDSTELSVQMEQNGEVRQVKTPLSQIMIRRITIISQSDLILSDK